MYTNEESWWNFNSSHQRQQAPNWNVFLSSRATLWAILCRLFWDFEYTKSREILHVRCSQSAKLHLMKILFKYPKLPHIWLSYGDFHGVLFTALLLARIWTLFWKFRVVFNQFSGQTELAHSLLSFSAFESSVFFCAAHILGVFEGLLFVG